MKQLGDWIKPIPTIDDFKEVMAADTLLYPYYAPVAYNPDQLANRKGGLFIYDKMRRDDAIRACLGLKKYAVLSSGWTITPYSKEDEDKEVANFVTSNLKLMQGSFDDTLLQMMTSFEYGFSVTEKIFKIGQYQNQNSVLLDSLKTRKPHGIDFDMDVHGNLKEDGIIQARSDNFPTNKFILFVNNFEFGNWYGESDLRSCYRAWWSKDNIIKFWNIFLERYGMPPAVGKFTKIMENPTQDKAALEKVLKRLQSASSIVVPHGVELDFPSIKGRGAMSYETAVKAHDMAIARSLLIPSLLGVTEQGDTGSYSQSKTHFNVFLWIILKIRRSIEELLFESLIRPLIDYNYRVENYPAFTFLPLDGEKKLELGKLWLEAVDKGAIKSDIDDENLFRSILGWPERVEEEDEEEDGDDDDKTTKSKQFAVPTYKRTLTTYEKRVDFVAIERDLTTLETEGTSRIVEILTEQRDILKSFLEKKLSTNQVTPALIKSLQLKKLQDLQRIIKEVLHTAYTEGKANVRKEVGKSFAAFEKLPPVYAINWLTNKSVYVKGIIGDGVLKDVKSTLISALESGEPLKETIVISISGICPDHSLNTVRSSLSCISNYRSPNVWAIYIINLFHGFFQRLTRF